MMKDSLKNKRIIFLAIPFYGYSYQKKTLEYVIRMAGFEPYILADEYY